MQRKDNTGMVVAIVLIAIGLIWLFRSVAGLPYFNYNFNFNFLPYHHFSSGITGILFSWQMVLIVTGVVLIAGRRSSGIVLLVAGVIFLLAKMMHFSYWSSTFLIPAILITVGIVLIVRTALHVK